MRYNYIYLFSTLLFALSTYSCSTTKELAYNRNLHTESLKLDDILSEIKISPDIYEIHPIEFYEREINISDDFNSIEKSIVGLKDENFFKERKELILKNENIPDTSFAFPLPGARLLSPFGMRHGRRHTGVDLKVNRRDTIYAAFSGVARMVGWSRGYGNVVVIRHYNGLETVYAHASKQLVKSGDHITAGCPIAISGATGRATTDHLHFEIRVNGTPIDPKIVIDLTNEQIRPQRLVFSPDQRGKLKIESV